MGALGYSAIGLGALGGGYYYYANFMGKAPQVPATKGKDTGANPSSQDTQRGTTVPASADAKTFMGGDQGFIPLELEKSEDINHNTKRLFFKFDDPEKVSGLSIACMSLQQVEETKSLIGRSCCHHKVCARRIKASHSSIHTCF